MTPWMPSATQVSLALMLAVLYFGCWIALRRAVASLAVVLPIVFLAPWGATVAPAENTHFFPLSVALVWAFWLYLYSPSSKAQALVRPTALIIVSLSAAAMVAFSPQAWILLAVLAVYAAARPLSPKRFLLPLSLVLLPLALRLSIWLPQAISLDKVAWPSFWWDAWVTAGWSEVGFFDSLAATHVLQVREGLDALFWLPLALAFLATALEFRSEWWFGPTMLWAATLFVGAVFLGRDHVFQHSALLQMSLLIPFGMTAICKIRLVFPSSFL